MKCTCIIFFPIFPDEKNNPFLLQRLSLIANERTDIQSVRRPAREGIDAIAIAEAPRPMRLRRYRCIGRVMHREYRVLSG